MRSFNIRARPRPVLRLIASAAALVGVIGLAACGDRRAAPATKPEGAAAAEAGYVKPPVVEGVQTGPGGVNLAGQAQPGGRVRLATPQGEAVVAKVDEQGRWTIPLPPSAESRIFGLSVNANGREAQAEGYVLLGPAGQAAMLRAGAGAVRIDRGRALRLSAVDFDQAGGAAVSGEAPAGTVVVLRLDGAEAAQARVGPSGRFSISLPTPVKPGAHDLAVFEGGASDQARVTVSPPEPLTAGPMRSRLAGDLLRVDWMTPGGGVQTTLLIR